MVRKSIIYYLNGLSYGQIIDEAENNFIKYLLKITLKDTLGDRKKAAKRLNIKPRTFRYLVHLTFCTRINI